MPENYKYGGGASGSLMHPIVAALVLLAIVGLFALPRKYSALPILWTVLLVPGTQQIYVAGVHLFAIRLVVLFGLIRMISSGEGPGGKRLPGGMNGIDRSFLLCVFAQAVSVALLFHESQAVINQVSFVWDWAGGYLVMRWTLQNEKDVCRSLTFLALLILPVAIGMAIEQAKFFNVFSILGGVASTPAVREGKIRSAGIFAHPIIAGTVGAVIVPLFALLWKNGKSKILGSCGFISATVMMWTSNSSTCMMAYAGGFVALLFWPLRKSMRRFRQGLAICLVGLHLTMKAPVWFLISRVDLTGGSSSYHRAELIDQFVNHFRDWWLIGVTSTFDWGLDMWDVQNQYVNIGQAGGILAFTCFILVISRSFGMIGKARKLVEGDKNREWLFWFLGASLFSNVVGFFGVNYFDQSRMIFFFLLAMISAATASVQAGRNTAGNTAGSLSENPFAEPTPVETGWAFS